MGGPKNLNEVEVFLTNMFNDKNILSMPTFFRKIVASFIVKNRVEKSKETYKLIGGKSPIVDLTKKLVTKLQKRFKKNDVLIVYAMRYTAPFVKDIKELENKNITEVLAIPLYPHYSITTTNSSLEDFDEVIKNYDFKVKKIENFYKNQFYNEAIIDNILKSLNKDKANNFDLIFSAHGLPQKVIDNGDSYQDEIKDNILILKKILKKEGY